MRRNSSSFISSSSISYASRLLGNAKNQFPSSSFQLGGENNKHPKIICDDDEIMVKMFDVAVGR